MERSIEKSEYDTVKRLFLNDKKSVSAIARVYDVHRACVYTVLKNCGIEIKKRGMPKHFDMVGKTFGFLKVTGLRQKKEDKRGDWWAFCECKNCGKKDFEVKIAPVLRGATTSCGCRRDFYYKISGKNNKNFTGYEEIRGGNWSSLRARAKKRGQEFDITIEYAWGLYIKQDKRCALSGIPLCFGVDTRPKETTASLDRIDPNKGYVVGNVQWIHKDINVMKNMFNQEYFVNICRFIAANDKLSYISDITTEDAPTLKTNFFGDKMRNREIKNNSGVTGTNNRKHFRRWRKEKE